MKKLTFYTNPMSRGRIVRWMLEELGVSYETQVLDYASTMKSAEYLAINPMGKVPAIKHGDVVVTETIAICSYLADVFKDKGLFPQTDEEKASYYRWLFFMAGPFEQAIGIKSLNVELTADQQRSFGCGNPADTFKTLATAVSGSGYVAGDRFTAADVIVGSYIGFYMQFGMLEKLPEFVAYWDRLANRPARIRANEIDDKLLQANG